MSLSIFDGIRAAVRDGGGEVVLSADGNHRARPDVAIVVFGESPYAKWNGNFRSLDYQEPDGADERLIRRAKDAGIPVVAVFLTGRPLGIDPELDACDAFVVARLPGSEGGGFDVLLRDRNDAVQYDFVGKLSFSWPRRTDQFQLNRNEANYEPRFPYGFGLTYASTANE